MAEKNFRTDNKSFMIYKDWEELFAALAPEEAGRLIMALFAYAGRGEKPGFGGALKMAFLMMSAQLDRDGDKWDKVCERNRKVAENRWSKKKSTKSTRRTKNTDTDTVTDKDTDIDTDKDKDTDTDIDTDKDKDTDIDTDIVIVIDTEKDFADSPCGETKTTTTTNKNPNNSLNNAMKKPTLEEVRTYCEERKNGIDPEYFIDYYSAKGWKVGRNPMTDWKAAVRNWERREYRKTPPERPAYNGGFDLDEFYAYAESYDPETISLKLP